MQSRQQEKIYLDSNVWYSYITRGDYDPHYNKAYTIIESINKNNDSTAVISHLSLVELVNAIRHGVTKKAEYLGKIRDNTGIRQNLEKKIDGYNRDVMNLITRWEATGKLRIVDVTAPFTHVLKEPQ